MAKLAQVIVDVPAKQTNRPFDYEIPKQLEAWVAVGSRVAVPFGSRYLQGFVVGLHEQEGQAAFQLKAIHQVLDVQPALNPTLIALSEWMSRKYVCPQIKVLQAMIPAALKVKYERGLFVVDEAYSGVMPGTLEHQLWHTVLTQPGMSKESLIAAFPGAAKVVKKALVDGWLEERQSMKEKAQVKQQLIVRVLASSQRLQSELDKTPGNAVQQKKLLAYFMNDSSAIAVADVLKNTSCTISALRALEKKQLVEIGLQEVARDPYQNRVFDASQAMALTDEQTLVCETLCEAITDARQKTYLLHGVTGSGKTEVYLQAIAHCISQKKQAIVLVPEIALTPQMVERFKSRFGDAVAVLHSRLSIGERFDEWRKIGAGRVNVAIGARSAVFAPFERLGLIIIDEEHETSYKQEESPKYHTRDVAIARASLDGAVVVLGSATPSLESYVATKEGRYKLLTMSNRVFKQAMPEVAIVDMREELAAGNRSMFSRSLQQAIADRQTRGEQTILLLNRRGHSTFVMCRSCGYTVQCPHCEIALTYHKQSSALRCHYCGYAEREPDQCPSCASPHIRYFGTGTQRVEEQLVQTFPGLRVIRMDVDTTATKGAHEALLTRFRNKEADVLLGTQMVAKGLDFPDVTLVGVIAADTVLHLPDFRASERTFQLLTQVAGRAGRHQLPGEVVIQTYHPDHYSLLYAQQHDFAAFVEKEVDLREKLLYPPYCQLALITVSHRHQASATAVAQSFIEAVQASVGGSAVTILGPVPAPIAKMKDRYRMQCLVKYREDMTIQEALHAASLEMDRQISADECTVQIDVDPQMFM